MIGSRPLARRLLQITAVVALPGILWASFEMFGLTLAFGAQMLFFSAAHGLLMGLPILLLLVGIPAGFVWLIECLVALISRQYRARLGVGQTHLAIVTVALASHTGLLASYELWSGTALRVPVCVVGLLATAALVRAAFSEVFAERPENAGVLE